MSGRWFYRLRVAKKIVVLYLTGVTSENLRPALLADGRIGLMGQPGSYGMDEYSRWPVWAADNACFSDKWQEGPWIEWIKALPRRGCLFAVLPDVVGDPVETLKRAHAYEWLHEYLPTAYVLQDGAKTIPECDAVFVGGSTEWKYSGHLALLVRQAKNRGLWAHMGRVNSHKRLAWASFMGCDSVDGTFLKYGPDVNLPRLLSWLDQLATHPTF